MKTITVFNIHRSSHIGLLTIWTRTILTGAWTQGSCVEQKFEVGLSISLLATRPWLFEIDMICLAYELKPYMKSMHPASFLTCFDENK